LAGLEGLKRGLKRFLVASVLFVLVFVLLVPQVFNASFSGALEADARGLPEERVAQLTLEALHRFLLVVLPLVYAYTASILVIYFRQIVPGLGRLAAWRPEFRRFRRLIAVTTAAGGALSLVFGAVQTAQLFSASPEEVMRMIREQAALPITFPAPYTSIDLTDVVQTIILILGLAWIAGHVLVLLDFRRAFGDKKYTWAAQLLATSTALRAPEAAGFRWVSLPMGVLFIAALIIAYGAVSSSLEKLELEVASALHSLIYSAQYTSEAQKI